MLVFIYSMGTPKCCGINMLAVVRLLRPFFNNSMLISRCCYDLTNHIDEHQSVKTTHSCKGQWKLSYRGSVEAHMGS